VGPSFSPLDEELGLLPGQLTPTLHADLVRLGTWLPFQRAAQELAHFTKVVVSETTATRLTEAAGAAYVAVQAVELARIEREHPASPVGPAVQQMSADGAFVPLVGGIWAEVKTLVLGTVREHAAPGAGAPRPAPQATHLTYFSRLAEAEAFGQQATVETFTRGTATAGTVPAVMDGAEWLQGFIDLQRPDAVRILDFPHALAYLAAAAQEAFGAGTAATSEWLAQQAHRLARETDGVEQVLDALRTLPTAIGADPAQAQQAQATALGYLGKRIEQMRYATFQAQGYPIGSGAVESANKLVVEARLKGSGMHWARAHVNPLLALRTIVCSDRWATAWPQIAAELHAQATRRQRQRRADRASRAIQAPPIQTPVAVLTTPAAPSGTPGAPMPPRGRTIVNGRPTAWHPWKRFALLPSGRRALDPLPPHPKR
jgi:hypothetical protein